MSLNREVTLYVETEDFRGTIEKGNDEDGERFAFLHLDVYNWNKSVYKQLKQMWKEMEKDLLEQGFNMVSFYLPSDVGTKFHSKIKPLSFKTFVGVNDEYVVGGWFLGEDNGS